MKYIIFAVVILVATPGCELFRNLVRPAAPVAQAPLAFNAPPTKEQIIQQINSNTAKIQQLQSDVSIGIPGVPSITGTLAIERPKRLRLKAGLLGMTATGIDAGSNEETFWLWQKTALPGQQPTMFYARHEEYASSPTRQVIPLDPTWIIEAVGLLELDPNGTNVTGPFQRTDGNLEIHHQFSGPTGPMSKVLVIDAQRGHVLQQHVRNSSGQWVASTQASDYRFDSAAQVSLPYYIEIKALPGTAQEMSLTMTAHSFNVNGIYADPSELWGMPQPQGVQVINIAQPPSPNQAINNVRQTPNLSRVYQPAPNYQPRQSRSPFRIRGVRGENLVAR